MKGIWQKSMSRYGPDGEKYMIGKIRVGYAGYNGTGSRDVAEKYKGECFLPSLKTTNVGPYMTQDEAKAAVERLVVAWFKGLES